MNEQTKQRIEENRAKHIRPGSDGRLSLVSMLGKKVIDLEGYISSEYGFDSPIFHVSGVVLEDGEILRLQGEHDIVYFPADDVPGLTNRDLLLCMDPDDIDEDEEEDFIEYLGYTEEDQG